MIVHVIGSVLLLIASALFVRECRNHARSLSRINRLNREIELHVLLEQESTKQIKQLTKDLRDVKSYVADRIARSAAPRAEDK